MNLHLNEWRHSLQAKSTLAIIITAAVLIGVTSAVQYIFASKGIREEVEHRAKAELQVKNLEIQKVMTAVEVALENMSWTVEKTLGMPDSICVVTRRLVEQNTAIMGCGVAFVENYYPQKGRWFEPYVVRREGGKMETSQIGSASHDYLHAEWFIDGMAATNGRWSEPYYDEAGAKTMLCTYTIPIHDAKGRTVAVMGADVSLDWLGGVINARPIYPSSYNLVISRTGQMMACPEESLVMRRSIQEVTSKMKDTTAKRINREMMEGKSGQTVVTNEKGEKNYVFFAPVDGETGWSMAVVCPDKEIFKSLRRVGLGLFVLMLAGLALIGLIISRAVRGFKNLQAVRMQNAAMENELKIASGIQMSMLPKIFPPYPDRDDIDIYGTLTAARAVGGDLYDFYIRDNNLFFCIGDVAGKGVPAALVMAMTRALLRTVSAHEPEPDKIVETLNEAMTEGNESNMFVTLFLGVLDLKTGRLRYCNAGHEAPLLVGRQVGVLPCDPNLIVGVVPGRKYTCQETMIDHQTTIFMFTDGLTEAENSEHELFGRERVLAVANAQYDQRQHQPELLIGKMADAVRDFVGGAEQSDDLTMLAVQFN